MKIQMKRIREKSRKNEPDQSGSSEADPEADKSPGNEENGYHDPIHGPGDVYGDGQVNARDVVLSMQYMMREVTLTEAQVKAADVNKDGIVDIRDVVLLMQYILRMVDSFD